MKKNPNKHLGFYQYLLFVFMQKFSILFNGIYKFDMISYFQRMFKILVYSESVNFNLFLNPTFFPTIVCNK